MFFFESVLPELIGRIKMQIRTQNTVSIIFFNPDNAIEFCLEG